MVWTNQTTLYKALDMNQRVLFSTNDWEEANQYVLDNRHKVAWMQTIDHEGRDTVAVG
jgi:hypothetical protein